MGLRVLEGVTVRLTIKIYRLTTDLYEISVVRDDVKEIFRVKAPKKLIEEMLERYNVVKDIFVERVDNAHSDDTGIMDVSKGEPYPFPY